MENKSDYKKVRTQIEKLLPAPYQSETITSIMENTANRFLTKKETSYVDGYVGKHNTSAIYSRQINEDTITAQANQLQPVISATLGTEKRYMSWTDIINELEEQGVDMEQFSTWGQTEKYNWVPPIDIDKLIHYRDYFWVNEDANSSPEYITIKRILNEVTTKLLALEKTIEQYGSSFSITGLLQSTPTQTFTITNIDSNTNEIHITSDATSIINVGDYITVKNTADNNQQFNISGVLYNGSNTILSVAENIDVSEIIGQVDLYIYDGFVVDGNLTQLFEKGLVVFIENSDNTQINNTFIEVITSNGNTEIRSDISFTDSRFNGVLSLEAELAILSDAVTCESGTAAAYGFGLWDNNSATDEIWNGDFASLIDNITNVEDPTDGGTQGQLWYATGTDRLFGYNEDSETWMILYNNFNLILKQVSNNSLFDFSDDCATPVSTTERQWSDNNHWVHRADVQNFASARQANYPIIEFFRNLQINEYIETKHLWKYRSGSTGKFKTSVKSPNLIELKELNNFTLSNFDRDIIFDFTYGDMTELFKEDFKFTTDLGITYTTKSSVFKYDAIEKVWNTIVSISTSVDQNTEYFRPATTTFGDVWLGYDRHWVYGGIIEEVPSISVAPNLLNDIYEDSIIEDYPSTGDSVIYTQQIGNYAQRYEIIDNRNTTFSLSTENLRKTVLIDSNDLRVYLNDVRLYGEYTELSNDGSEFVSGIKLNDDVTINTTDVLLIEVGTAALSDTAFSNVKVRTTEDDKIYAESPRDERSSFVSAVKIRKSEQVKTNINQYPRFSIFNMDGSSANLASSIFEFKIDKTAAVATELGLRVAVDALTENYTFSQTLLNPNDELYAYSELPDTEFWVDRDNKIVYRNIEGVWASHFVQGDVFDKAIYSDTEPTVRQEYTVWFDSTSNEVKIYNGTEFVVSNSVIVTTNNPSLSTIWKKAKDLYIPQKKDWHARTLEEYNSERTDYINANKISIAFNNPELSDIEVTDQATIKWLEKQSNKLSPTGEWVGEWTMPDYLYHNPMNENRIDVTTRELTAHFESIINSQSRVPGYIGDRRSQFHTLTQYELDLGIGGKIHQYNNNFSTFISSMMIDNIVVPDLFEFAQNQHQILLDNTRDISIIATKNVLLSKPSDNIINDIINYTKSKRSEDSNVEFIYGDTTLYDINSGAGVRNWIATLPNIGMIEPIKPSVSIDPALNLYELVHHDGHRVNYALDSTQKNDLIDSMISYYKTGDKNGTVADIKPFSKFSDLQTLSNGNDVSLTKGYFWINSKTRKVYYAYIDFIQNSNAATPATVEGAYWVDTAFDVLNYSDGTTWSAVDVRVVGDLIDGAEIETSKFSVWRELDLNELALNAMLDIETRLYESSIESKQHNFNITSDMKEYFLSHTKNIGNELPFVNTDYNILDPFSWNYKTSVFGNKYDVLTVDLNNNAFIIAGTFASIFAANTTFYIKNSDGNDGTWTVTTSEENDDTQTTVVAVEETITSVNTGMMYKGSLPSPSKNTGAESASYWKALYKKFYGTSYPNLEPWVLQGYNKKPDWWDVEYKNDDPKIYGDRRWKQIVDADDNDVGMWTNIIHGRVPEDRELPNGEISTSSTTDGLVTQYDYVSVNIGHDSFIVGNTTVYNPDDLYPPYLNVNEVDVELSSNNRSLFTDSTFEVIGPTQNYAFGDEFQLECEWRESSQFLYDFMTRAYIESPIKVIADTFGYDEIHLDKLVIDSRTNNVPSYKRTVFHGEIIDNEMMKFHGINQWYINYNRYTNVDTNFSNFLKLWTSWTAPLAYRFNSFIDVRTLDVENSQVDVESNIDYSVYIKKTSGVESFSANGLITTLISIPPKVINYDNSHLWKIQVSNNSTRNNEVNYYGVRNYPFYADPNTNTMKIYTYSIVNVNVDSNTISIDGDLTDIFGIDELAKFSTGLEIPVFASTYNDITGDTTVYFTDSIESITTSDLISADVISLPWETGDSVWFTSERKLPAPLYGDTPPIGPIEYFIIRVSDTEFRVAETKATATLNLPTVLINSGTSIHYVGEIVNTFVVGSGSNTSVYWRHYKLDDRIEKTINMPSTINGVQQYINIVDGYVEKLNERGFTFADDTFGWQNQLERFIDYSFSVRKKVTNRTVGNRFPVQPDKQTNTWVYTDSNIAPIETGYAVNLISNIGTGLPSPFLGKLAYYVINNIDGTFSLASSYNKAIAGIPIKLIDNGSSNNIEMFGAVSNTTRYPRIEVNTFKDKISFRPPYGVVSNVIDGPFTDINVANTIRDQYGDPMLISDFTIHRHDKQTDVMLTTAKRIDQTRFADEIDALGVEGYHYMSSATFYIDTYEHIVEFANYTNDDNLLYDGFVGLNLQRFYMNFNRPEDTSLRPNIGGSTVITEDKNIKTIDNIERMTDDLRYAYGAVSNNESNRYAPYARATLGYDINSTEDYLDAININEKSQFLFWQGLIQVKGSTLSVDSFINSKKFVDARVDEYWAYEVAEFGSVEEQEYPQMYINKDDIINNSAKFEFIEASEVAKPGFGNSTYGVGGYDITSSSVETLTGEYKGIAVNDSARWYKQPDQASTLEDNGLVMYFESTVTNSIELNLFDYIGKETPTVIHNFKTNSVVVVVEVPDSGIDKYTAGTGFETGDSVVVLNSRYIPFIDQLNVFKNGIPLIPVTDFSDVNQEAGMLTTNKVAFTKPLLSDDVVEVSIGSASLDSSIHFTTVNSNMIKFDSDDIFNYATKITLWNLQPNFEAQNASKLIDIVNDSVISSINLFDPARGVYNQQAFNDVDIITDIPPAFFNKTDKLKLEPARDSGYITKQLWGKAEVGTIWLDTAQLAFIPYYDENIFNETDERLEHWGKQAAYSNMKVYEWVESDVPPNEWDGLVNEEQGNASIPEHLQKSGTPKQTMFYIDRGGHPDYTTNLVEVKNYVSEFSVELNSTYIEKGTYSFHVPTDIVKHDYFGLSTFSVYVNGIYLRDENIAVTSIIVDNLKPADYVQLVIKYDNVNDEIIDKAVKDEIIRLTYEYTQVKSYSDLGEEIITYYFWVEDKLTRPKGNSVSAKEIENKWTKVTYPYIVLQNLIQSGRVASVAKENIDVNFEFSINKHHLEDNIQYLQIGQNSSSYRTENDTSTGENLTPYNGSYELGTQYQPDDILVLTNGVVVKVISSDGQSNGEVTDFEIIYSGETQPTLGQELIQQELYREGVLISDSNNKGNGFTITPKAANLGGFILRLGSDLMSLIDDSDIPESSNDTLVITINNDLISEKSDETRSGEFVILDKRSVIVGRKVKENDVISVSYTSNKPERIDNLPDRYTQIVLRNLKNYVKEDNRYTVRFRRDFTNDSKSEVNNKALHKQWKLFRQYQQSNVDRNLWDKVTESMIGYKLSDSTSLVPSLSRKLYDAQNVDNTRYGLGDGQAFVNGSQALITLLSDINDVDNEFRGVDVASFLETNTFDTPENIITSMDTIYTTFPVEDVNRLFFLFLNDALSNKTEYAKLLKTSMISIYGVKVLDTQDLFDE